MKVIIIEDEVLSAELLQKFLHKIDPNIEVVINIDSVKQSVSLFKNGLIADLIFLDVHLADGNSFEIFNDVKIETPIIFTTAYNEYAIKAFQLNSIDYLLKPIGLDELTRAIEKFKKLNYQNQHKAIQEVTHIFHQNVSHYKNRFLVKMGSNIDSIKTEDVHHFTTIDSITFLVANNGKKFPIDYSLDVLEPILMPHMFFRINRKTILNISSIEKVNTFINSRLSIIAKFLDGEGSIVSRDRVGSFKAWLDK